MRSNLLLFLCFCLLHFAKEEERKSEQKMAEAGAFPAEFRKLEEDFVDSKMAINNSVNDILHNQGTPRPVSRLCVCAVVSVLRALTGKTVAVVMLLVLCCCYVLVTSSTATQIAQASVVEAQRCVRGACIVSDAVMVRGLIWCVW